VLGIGIAADLPYSPDIIDMPDIIKTIPNAGHWFESAVAHVVRLRRCWAEE
jgi:hypothetical protein